MRLTRSDTGKNSADTYVCVSCAVEGVSPELSVLGGLARGFEFEAMLEIRRNHGASSQRTT